MVYLIDEKYYANNAILTTLQTFKSIFNELFWNMCWRLVKNMFATIMEDPLEYH